MSLVEKVEIEELLHWTWAWAFVFLFCCNLLPFVCWVSIDVESNGEKFVWKGSWKKLWLFSFWTNEGKCDARSGKYADAFCLKKSEIF